MKKVLICIQARSSSTRLPNKIHLQIDGKSILQTIIESCSSAVTYVNRDKMKLGGEASVCLLIPVGDAAGNIYRNQMPVIEGDEHDVLHRFMLAVKKENPDYVVRVTSDCYFLPSHLIAKHIKSALIKQRDYTTNCVIRTFKEGWDIQVFSKRLLEWIDKNATTEFDREHVGTVLGDCKDFPFKDAEGRKSICHIINNYDESEYKTSIDTKEEFEKAKAITEKFRRAKDAARRNGIFIA